MHRGGNFITTDDKPVWEIIGSISGNVSVICFLNNIILFSIKDNFTILGKQFWVLTKCYPY